MRPHSAKSKNLKPVFTKSKNLKPVFTSPKRRTPAAFKTGDSVEISSKEEGFLGSYYEATVVAKITSNEYVVEYKTLLEDDNQSRPLREVVAAADVRPAPPPLDRSSTRFLCGDVVDAFDNDGWWIGTIRGMNLDTDMYYVHFPLFMVGIAYHASKIRIHQDWDKGNWSVISHY